MTQPWYPFYWSDYSGKTMHLSMGQHGAYMLFLRWVYTTEKAIPHKQRYSIARAMTEQEQGDADFVLSEFFTREGDEWRSKRAEKVIHETKNRHEKRVNAGKKGGLAKSSNAREMLEQKTSNALVTTPTTTTTIYNPPNPPKSGRLQPPKKGGFNLVDGNGGLGFDISHHLNDNDLMDARVIASGWDIHYLMRVYNDGINNGTRPKPNKPSAAFLGWLPKYTKGKRP